MSMSVLMVVSVISALEILFILWSFNKHMLKVFLGYKVYVDLLYGVGFSLYMMTTGTVSGLIIAAFGGFFMTLTLSTAAAFFGYRQLKTINGKKVWVETAPTLTIEKVKQKSVELKDKVIDMKDRVMAAA